MTRIKLRIFLVLGALAVLIVSAAGCISGVPVRSNSTAGSGNSGVAVAVNSQQTASQIGIGYLTDTPKAGDVFLIYDVTVTNLNQNSWDIGNPYYFKLSTAGGTVYEITTSTFLGDKALTPVSNTNPGEKVSGQIAFEVPQSAKATSLTYSDGINQVITNLSGVSSTTTPTVTPSATPPPAPSATPQDVYQVVISGPNVLQPGQGGTWIATVYKNGVPLQTGNIYWYIDGHLKSGTGATFSSDANGEETTWAPPGAHILNAEYMGDPAYPNTSIIVTSLGVPSVTPTPFPTATPSPTLTPTIIR
jgi:hypothetical protein